MVDFSNPECNTDPLTDDCFRKDIQQKGVDTKFGLDVAWMSFCNVVDRIILVTGDSDFVPAIKAARRNGIQVILCTLNHGISKSLKNNADVINIRYKKRSDAMAEKKILSRTVLIPRYKQIIQRNAYKSQQVRIEKLFDYS
jgi:uncharacterized LabA/DUF88 family protein